MKIIKAIDSAINFAALVIIIFALALSAYALWDSGRIYREAQTSLTSFEEARALNDEVIAWLKINETNINYPVAHTTDNIKYVNTNILGEYSLAGAIFLDYRNDSDFLDFNSFLYGHHMAKRTMFGELGDFAKPEIFERRKNGILSFGDKDYSLEFFAFIHADAYDFKLFSPNILDKNEQTKYLNYINSLAINKRDLKVSIDDNLVLLITCSSASTNGRDVLIGKISDIEELKKDETELARIRIIALTLKIILIALIIWRLKNILKDFRTLGRKKI